jgi:nicotinate-nucleotide--dimethylbenzimidazole phosphoribosyltransferase
MVQNFLGGGAAINVLCRRYGIQNVIVDVEVDHDFDPIDGLVQRKVRGGTRNFVQEEAMTDEEAHQCVEVGFQLAQDYADQGAGLVGVGEMGIGNTTSASAIFSAATQLAAQLVTGRGTGVDSSQIQHKIQVISEALDLHQPASRDPWDILKKVRGYEIGAIMGMALGCATLGALLACLESPQVKEYLFFSHSSREKGHSAVLDWLGVRPLLDLDLCLGEGTGAAIAMDLINVSVKLMTEMATFEESQVSKH